MSKPTAHEIMDRIYDSLMGNVGLSKHHVAFPVEEVKNQYVGGGRIYLEINNEAFEIIINGIDVEADPRCSRCNEEAYLTTEGTCLWCHDAEHGLLEAE